MSFQQKTFYPSTYSSINRFAWKITYDEIYDFGESETKTRNWAIKMSNSWIISGYFGIHKTFLPNVNMANTKVFRKFMSGNSKTQHIHCTLGQISVSYPKIHMFKITYLKKFTFLNHIFLKKHIFKISFFTKISFSKSHFSQKSNFKPFSQN